MGTLSYYYAAKNTTSNEEKSDTSLKENNEEEVYSLYIDPNSSSLWQDKPLTLYSPDRSESHPIAIVGQSNQTTDDTSTALSLISPGKSLIGKIMEGLWQVTKTGVEMGVTHIQHQPSQLRQKQ